jgi:DNA-binding NarL/FixJ family response regulator
MNLAVATGEPSLPNTRTFTRREPNIVEMMCLGSSTKDIAPELEISFSAVNANIARACTKAKVTRKQIVMFSLQHSAALEKGGRFSPGLHDPECPCNEPHCKGMRRVA